ncbi:MAG: hypothetical protein IT326_01645, partial [Anaerolineae bacterium]|nr:hypothetical protein [Anaerolineae bacterium]
MAPRFRRFSLTGPVAVLALLAAVLACNVPGASRPQDARATVVAVYGTITAQAQITPGGAVITPSAPMTPGPTLSLSPSATPSATPPASRAADGSVITIPRCTGAVTTDGALGEWDAQTAARFALDRAVYGNTRWTGPGDASADARACWTDTALVLGVSVTDDAHVQTEQGETAWQGDEIELLFDGDLRGDYYEARWNSDDVQIGLSPGDFAGLPPSAVRFHPALDESLALMLMAQRPLAT